MKKLLLLFIAAICSFLYVTAAPNPSSIKESYEIELEKTPIKQSSGEYRPRTINFLEAYYDITSGVVDIIHDALGETTIYLINSLGQIIYQYQIYSSSYGTDKILLPDLHDSYTLVIDSEVVYAIGVVIR